MSFQFRFDALLQLRRRERDQAAVALGQAGQAIERVRGEISELESSRQTTRQDGRQRRIGEISVDDLLTRGRYDLQLEGEIQQLRQTLIQLDREANRRRETLTDAEAEVKRFERLLEKDRARYLAEQRRREQFEADDATGRRYTLQRQSTPNDL